MQQQLSHPLPISQALKTHCNTHYERFMVTCCNDYSGLKPCSLFLDCSFSDSCLKRQGCCAYLQHQVFNSFNKFSVSFFADVWSFLSDQTKKKSLYAHLQHQILPITQSLLLSRHVVFLFRKKKRNLRIDSIIIVADCARILKASTSGLSFLTRGWLER